MKAQPGARGTLLLNGSWTDGSLPEKENRNEETARFVRSYRIPAHRSIRARQRCPIRSCRPYGRSPGRDGKGSLAPLPPSSSQAVLPPAPSRHQPIFRQQSPRLQAPAPLPSPRMVVEGKPRSRGAFFRCRARLVSRGCRLCGPRSSPHYRIRVAMMAKAATWAPRKSVRRCIIGGSRLGYLN